MLDGRSHSGRDTVNAETYQMCNIKPSHKDNKCDGASCTVTYLPRDPAIHCLGSADQRLHMHIHSTILSTAIIALVLAGALGWIEWSTRRELHLARVGETTEGRIVERVTSQGRNRTIYRARYQFETPAGMRWMGWVSVSYSLWQYLLPGTAVTVLYDPDHPGRHCPAFGFRYVSFWPGPIPE
jgi:hypothetical protein